MNKGQEEKGQKQSERESLILDFVRKNNGVSIKDIAKVVKGCRRRSATYFAGLQEAFG
jgi:hypothetical protein